MRKVILVLISTGFFWLSACQNPTPVPKVPESAVPVAIPVSQNIEGAENYCISCHTDKDRLIASAKPEEMVEAESSGAG